MDFKVSGTVDGITGIQLDLKARGLSVEQMVRIFEQAKQGRLDLIKQMHDQIDHDVPWVLMEFRVIFALYHDWYLPAKPNPFAYTYFKFAYSDSERRAEKAQEWTDSPFWPGFIMFVVFLIPVSLAGYKVYQQR